MLLNLQQGMSLIYPISFSSQGVLCRQRRQRSSLIRPNSPFLSTRYPNLPKLVHLRISHSSSRLYARSTCRTLRSSLSHPSRCPKKRPNLPRSVPMPISLFSLLICAPLFIPSFRCHSYLSRRSPDDRNAPRRSLQKRQGSPRRTRKPPSAASPHICSLARTGERGSRLRIPMPASVSLVPIRTTLPLKILRKLELELIGWIYALAFGLNRRAWKTLGRKVERARRL